MSRWTLADFRPAIDRLTDPSPIDKARAVLDYWDQYATDHEYSEWAYLYAYGAWFMHGSIEEDLILALDGGE